MALTEMFTSEDSPFYMLGHVLAGVGAVNWGVIGVTSLMGEPVNLVTSLLGDGAVTYTVYTLVGLGGLQVLGDSLEDYGLMG